MRTRFAVLLACFSLTLHSNAVRADNSLEIRSQAIHSLDLRKAGRTNFGDLKFVGGLVLRSSDRNFGGMSALNVGEADRITAITDAGFWVIGRIDRDNSGRPTGVSNASISPLLNTNGRQFENKWLADAEGMAVARDQIFVSMEQDSRIISYPRKSPQGAQSSQSVPDTEFTKELRSNFALEAIASAPIEADLPFDLVAVSEFSPNKAGNARAFFSQSGKWNEFQIPLLDSYLITDAAFMMNGDLLVLERRFSLATGARARVRQIPSTMISLGNLATGRVIMELDGDQMIDNMEGITVFRTADNKMRLALISDNNLFPLQRTLYLEFEWLKKD